VHTEGEFGVERIHPSLATLKRLRSVVEIHFALVVWDRCKMYWGEDSEGSCMRGTLPWEMRMGVGCRAR
jgi:hypothetical protein